MKKYLLIISLGMIVPIYSFFHPEPQRHPASPVSEKNTEYNINDYSENIEDKIFNESSNILILIERVEDNKTFAWLKNISSLTERERVAEEAALKNMLLDLFEILETDESMTPENIKEIFTLNHYEPVLIEDKRPHYKRNGRRIMYLLISSGGLTAVGTIGLAVIGIASLPVSAPVTTVLSLAGGIGFLGTITAAQIGINNLEKREIYILDDSISELIHKLLEDWKQQNGMEQLDFVSMFNPGTIDLQIE